MSCRVAEVVERVNRHGMDWAGRTVLLVLSLSLASCALAPKSAPVPVEDRAPGPAPPPVPEPAGKGAEASSESPGLTEALPQPAPPAAPDGPLGTTPAQPPAVVALLDRVDSAAASGNPAQAAAELERALRISPRDDELWLRLARVRMQQKQWQQAEAVALKCLSLPESDAFTKKAAWSLIGSARQARGDSAGAAAARQRAAAIIPR